MADAHEIIAGLIASGKRFFVAPDPLLDDASLFAAAALKKVLEAAGKEVFFWPQVPDVLVRRHAPLLAAEPPMEIPRKIKIRIPKSVALDEMRYDDEPDAVAIVISPKHHLDIKDLLIERAPYDVDAAFCFFDDEAEFAKLDAPIQRPPRERTIFFVRNQRTLAEKVFGLARPAAEVSLPPDIASLLLASLIVETGGLRRAAPEALRLAATLMEYGADAASVGRALERPMTSGESQLFGRALARTATDAAGRVSWTFLAARDFERAGMEPSPDRIAAIVARITMTLADPPPLSILCFDRRGAPPAIQTRLAGRPDALRRAARILGLPAAGPLPLDGPTFPTFSEAETRLRELLRGDADDTIRS